MLDPNVAASIPRLCRTRILILSGSRTPFLGVFANLLCPSNVTSAGTLLFYRTWRALLIVITASDSFHVGISLISCQAARRSDAGCDNVTNPC
jgi:hypothetical protein